MLKISDNRYAFSVELIFNKSFENNLDVRYYIDTRPIMRNISVRFIDLKMNICEAIGKKYDIPFLQVLIVELRRCSNIPYQCPFKKVFIILKKSLISPHSTKIITRS